MPNRTHEARPEPRQAAAAMSGAAPAPPVAGAVAGAPCRDFGVVEARVRAAGAPRPEPGDAGARAPTGFATQVLGRVDGHALWHAHLAGGRGAPRLLLIAGTHGDEPATVEAALQVLEGTAAVELKGFAVDVLPCTNPTGYEMATRATAAGLDLNWSWDRDGVPEIEILRTWLQGRRWDAILDLHEDWETGGFYLYEHCHGVAAAGPRMVQAVARDMDINRATQIEGWPACDGVVTADSSRERLERGDGLPLVLLRDHTPHKMTTETPTALPLARRVRAQHAALRALLDHYREATSSCVR